MYLFGGIGPDKIYGDLWRYNLDNYYWEKIFESSDISPRYNFQYTTFYDDETDSFFLAIVGGIDETLIGLQDFYTINLTDDNFSIYEEPSLDENCIDRPLSG